MGAELAIAAGAAGVAVVATSKGAAPPPVPPKQATNGGIAISRPSSGSTVMAPPMVIGTATSTYSRFLRAAAATHIVNAGIVSPTNPIDAELQKKLDELKSWGKAAYDKLSSAAKKAGADALNKELGLDPPLKGDESWEDILKRCAAPAAGKAGAALGNAIGGPAGAALGEAIGKYLGGKLEDLISKNADEVADWFKSRWGDIEGFVEGAVDDIGDAAKDVIDYLGGLF